MSNLMEKHFEKILNADRSAVDDYAQSIVSIVRAGGNPETLDFNGIWYTNY